MRIVFIGATNLVVMTVRNLLGDGHEVVIIEKVRERIKDLSDDLDCGFIHGDGSKPAILREAGPEHTDFLFCMTGHDQINIIAGLIGRSLGFPRVVTKIEDPELMHICIELGLDNTIIPTSTISRFLTDMVAGRDILELSAMIKGEARLFSFHARPEDEGPTSALDLPDMANVICYYHEGKFMMPSGDSVLAKDDEVVVLTHDRNLESLRKRWTGNSGG